MQENNSDKKAVWHEWYQTVYDQRVPRTALLTEIEGRIYEIILDESVYGSGAGIEIKREYLQPHRRNKIYKGFFSF